MGISMPNELIMQLPSPVIVAIKHKFADEIEFLERKNNLPPRSLFVQLGLHIYKYSCEDLFQCNRFDINQIKQYSINSNLIYNELFSLIGYLKKSLPVYTDLHGKSQLLWKDSKIISHDKQYQEIAIEGVQRNIHFQHVLPDIGAKIQEDIHYIRSRRLDTLYEFGLFTPDTQVPFAYAAFSLLDRHYLLNLPLFNDIPKDRIFVLTRAYSFPNSPYNSMSALYSKCFDFLKKNAGAAYVVTAINQNLFFSGASLQAANMTLIATSPMKHYYLDGRYSTRRKLERTNRAFEEQKFKAAPIMWFGKNLMTDRQVQNITPTIVSEEMYDLQ